MNLREYHFDVAQYRFRIIRLLVKRDITNPTGLATTLIQKTVPNRNGGLSQVIRWLTDSPFPNDVRWLLVELSSELYSEILIPSTSRDDVTYRYNSVNDTVTGCVSTPMDRLTPTEWLNELKESGYDVDTNVERLFGQYQSDSANRTSGYVPRGRPW